MNHLMCPHCGKPVFEVREQSAFSEKDIQRFWSRIVKTDTCWTHPGLPSGIYGRLRIGGRSMLAHVVAWIVTNGQIPDGKKVCHKCDNTRCVRPDHLFLGTHSENMLDMVAKGRNKPLIGELNPISKVDGEQVLFIRTSLANKTATIEELAARFGLTFQAVYQIATGHVWQSVGGPLLQKRIVRHLTVDEVLEIRRRAAAGEPQASIADSFGIWQATVSNIVRGIKRRDVPILCPSC